MNKAEAVQEGLTVVAGAFERQEGTGAAFPQYDGSVTGDARLDGRLYDIEIDGDAKAIEITLKHGPVTHTIKLPYNEYHETNSKAPRFKTTKPVEIGEYEWQVSAWLAWTKKETRYFSLRFQRVESVDDSLMDRFEGSAPKRQTSFIDDLDNDSREAIRDDIGEAMEALVESHRLNGEDFELPKELK